MQHIKSTTHAAIEKALGFKVIFVSWDTFEAHNSRRTRYTVRRPNGKKFYHLIGYENGDIEAC